jgi:alpha-soluble NSF attachment protein
MDKSEADNLVKQAEKKLNAGFFSRMFSSKESRLEEALDLYERAANQFKLQKRWLDAGDCYEHCSKIEEELGSDAAAGHYHDASHCFNFVDKKRANENMNKCLKVYEKLGRFQMAGKTQKQMAEDYEADLKYDEAIVAYKRAGEYFSMENQNSKTYEQGCLLKQADLMCISNHKDAFEEARNVRNLIFTLLLRFTKKLRCNT